MSMDFSRLIYKTIEKHMEQQVGPEERKKLTSKQWRVFMDDVMVNFSRALVAIVVQVSTQHVEAQKLAEKQAEEAKAAAKSKEPIEGPETAAKPTEQPFPTEDHLKAQG